MKIISLTQNQQTTIDDEDYDELMKNSWCYHGGYAVRGQRQGGVNNLIRMHNWIMKTPKGMSTDHINGDKLDNRKSNLRVVTKRQNGMNHGMNKNNTSGYKGVHHAGKNCRMKTRVWIAKIKVDYRPISLGYYETPREAAIAYNEAAMKYHGVYAKLNVIE